MVSLVGPGFIFDLKHTDIISTCFLLCGLSGPFGMYLLCLVRSYKWSVHKSTQLTRCTFTLASLFSFSNLDLFSSLLHLSTTVDFCPKKIKLAVNFLSASRL